MIWSVIVKYILKSLAASTLTLKQFIRNLINYILICRKVIVKHMLTLKALWLIVISPFLFNVYWAISLSSILMIYLLKYYFLCFVIINLVRLYFWVYLLFLLLLCFVSRSFFSLEKLLKKLLFFLRHRLIIEHKFEIFLVLIIYFRKFEFILKNLLVWMQYMMILILWITFTAYILLSCVNFIYQFHIYLFILFLLTCLI